MLMHSVSALYETFFTAPWLSGVWIKVHRDRRLRNHHLYQIRIL